MSELIFETAASSSRFNLLRFSMEARVHFSTSTYDALLKDLDAVFGDRVFKKIFERVIRSVFFIEPVNRDITSTKFEVRWGSRNEKFFEFGASDPRYCTFKDCLVIFEEILSSLHDSRNDPDKRAILEKCLTHGLISHEILLDYCEDDPAKQIHRPGNIQWQWGTEVNQMIGLRAYLRSIPGENGDIFKNAIESKVCVKTYLTDRAQTGAHQTNREKRWEAHPASVQYASRKTCWGIEHELLSQLCFFDGFPAEIKHKAIDQGILDDRKIVSQCPVTLEPLNFQEFSAEILSPSHGRSKFQVGHMNPLKSVGRDNPEAGHTRENISWVSSDGNRIQGHLSLADTRAMILRIAKNYNAAK